MREPQPRKDGKCALKGCNRKLPRTKIARRYAGHWLHVDPWCSSRCCRRFHGTELAIDVGVPEETIAARGAAGRRTNKARKAA